MSGEEVHVKNLDHVPLVRIGQWPYSRVIRPRDLAWMDFAWLASLVRRLLRKKKETSDE